jgi:CSLREA domain-containing protein
MAKRAAIVVAALAVTLAAAAPAFAATYRVTHRGDPAPGPCTASHCTLREAIIAANASLGTADTIVLPSTKPYVLANAGTGEDGAMAGDLDITNDALRIVHPGPGRAPIDANGIERVFEVFTGAPATFQKLVIAGGHAAGVNGYGGGIRSYARVTLIGTIVRGNRAAQCGGGIHVQNGAPLVLRGSAVTGNLADGDGGGISASCFGDGGATTVRNSTVSGNRSDADGSGNGYGGGIYLQNAINAQSLFFQSTFAGNRAGRDGGGIYTDLGRLRVERTTVSGNRTKTTGGGIEVDGTNPFLLVNSTVAGNRADSNGGGIHADGADIRLNAVTIVRNRGNADGIGSEAGGGIYNDAGAGAFRVANSILALNTLTALTPGEPPVKNDCSGVDPFTSGGNNLLTTRFLCSGLAGPGDIRRANPKLGLLKRNGGPTRTVALLAGSPAINEAGPSAPARDQRGVRRVRPDIGAYERR